MRIIFSFILLFGLSAHSLFSQTIPKKPKLIVMVVVENMKYEYISRFYPHFSDFGFKKIMQNGTSCTNVHIPFAYANPASAYTSIVTGSTPAEHGIIGSVWYNRILKKEEFAILDYAYNCVGCVNKKLFQVCPKKNLLTTFTDELELSSKGHAKTFSVGLTPESAVLMGGRLSDGVFWLDDKQGNWVTSSYFNDNIPQWLVSFNKKKLGDTYLSKTWTSKYPIAKYTQSLPDNTAFEIGFAGQNTFPYKLSALQNTFSPYTILTQTPFGNTFTKDLALNLIHREKLGQDSQTDLLTISFTALAEITHKFGSLSKEVQDCMIHLDDEINFLIRFLESHIGKENFILVVTSTSGVEAPTEYLKQTKNEGREFKLIEATYILEKHLETKYGKGPWIEYYRSNQIYLNRDRIENHKISLRSIQEESTLFLQKLAGIHTVLTAQAMNSYGFNDNIKQRMSNSYNQKRSGDIFIELMPGWSEQTVNKVAQHSSTYTETTHVPLFWYGWNIHTQKIHTSLSTTSIIPTLCEIVGIQRPNSSYGTYINITEQ